MSGRHRVLISLGSNVEPAANLSRALALLAGEVELGGASRVFRTAPVGAPGTPDFLNAAVSVATRLAPAALRDGVLRPIESRLGRVRGAERNAPRPIDLDIALFDDLVRDGSDGGPVIPDPEVLTRAHVAAPLADLEPERRHPVTGQRLAEIAARLGRPGEVLAIDGWPPPVAACAPNET